MSETELLLSIEALLRSLENRKEMEPVKTRRVKTMPKVPAGAVPAFVPARLMFEIKRGDLPASGPLIICEATGLPWEGEKFRRGWRRIAEMAGVPRSVKNMDSRAGAKMVRIVGRDFRDFERRRPGN